VHNIHYFITNKVHFEYQILFYIVFPFLGIALTTLIVLRYLKDRTEKELVLFYEIAQNSSIVALLKCIQVNQSAITVGLGGSAGLESPIAVTGAAIGSNYAQTYRLNYKERTLFWLPELLRDCSAFNAPIAGIMFAFEILLTEWFLRFYSISGCSSLRESFIQNSASGRCSFQVLYKRSL
jgi:CIC family chloride channel protein